MKQNHKPENKEQSIAMNDTKHQNSSLTKNKSKEPTRAKTNKFEKQTQRTKNTDTTNDHNPRPQNNINNEERVHE